MRFTVLGLLLSVLPVSAARHVGVVIDGQLEPPARYGIARLEQALTAKGLAVVHPRAGETARADFYVLAGVAKRAPQSLSIRRSTYRGKPAVILSGGDARGLMYAVLDTADRARYFDMLASSRINNFVVIFGYENGEFMAPLYPYFFNVPEHRKSSWSDVYWTGFAVSPIKYQVFFWE